MGPDSHPACLSSQGVLAVRCGDPRTRIGLHAAGHQPDADLHACDRDCARRGPRMSFHSHKTNA